MKYVLYIDYCENMEVKYSTLDAKELEKAIKEADYRIANDAREIYLARILKKVGKNDKIDGLTVEHYEAILCNRHYPTNNTNWHTNDERNGEGKHLARRYTKYDLIEIE